MSATSNHHRGPYTRHIKKCRPYDTSSTNQLALVLRTTLASSGCLVIYIREERTDVTASHSDDILFLSPLTGIGKVPQLLLPQHQE